MGFYTKTHEELINAGYKRLARWRVAYAEVLTFWGKDKYSGVSIVTFSGQTNKHLITQNDLDMLGEFFAGYDADDLQRFDYEMQYEYCDYFRDNGLQMPQGPTHDYVKYRTEQLFKKTRELRRPEISRDALSVLLEAGL